MSLFHSAFFINKSGEACLFPRFLHKIYKILRYHSYAFPADVRSTVRRKSAADISRRLFRLQPLQLPELPLPLPELPLLPLCLFS